jgi:hypothetical protein
VRYISLPIINLQAQFGDAAYCGVAGAIAFGVNFFVSIPLVFFTFVYGRQKLARNRASMIGLK